ncbi:MAG: hypothetical protein MHM6MM_000895 [Cercozoa sp. M6MM]
MGKNKRNTSNKSAAKKGFKKKYQKGKQRVKDMDERQEALQKVRNGTAKPRALDPDLPGLGQFECLFCDRHFKDAATLSQHCRTKLHKKMVKRAAEPMYTQEEADAAAGLGREKYSNTEKPTAADDGAMVN